MGKHRWKTLLGIAVTIALLAWVLRDVSAAEVWHELTQSNPLWLLLAVVLATLSFVLRAIRWRVLLEPAYDGTSFDSRFGAVCIGFAVNNVLPARLGEFTRAFALTRTEPIPLGASIASLIVERILDGVVLAIFLFVTISLPGFPLGEGSTAELVRRTANIGAIAFGLGLGLLWLAARRPEATSRLFDRTIVRWLPERFGDRASRAAASFVAGLGALASPGVFLRAMFWSFVVWIDLSLSIWAGLEAFDITGPGIAGAHFLQAVIAFAVAAPSSPGFFGVFEAAARVGLGPWNVAAARVVSFATSYHILTFIPVTLIGIWYLQRLGLSWSDVGRAEERGDAVAESEVTP
ncbi:MAG: flippase-like domain-containing protein [marine benthic group bacterium]|nr:flippase-like domain-containing protein [Gemmatimonadota bacterium]